MGVLLHLLIRLVLLPLHLVRLMFKVARLIGCAISFLAVLIILAVVVAVVLTVHH